MLQLNAEHLYRVFKDFYTLTKIRIVLFDSQQEQMSYPDTRQGFCARLRQDAREDGRCRLSDQNGCRRCAAHGDLVLYHCHAGLAEAVVPVFEQDLPIGYVMFGQVIPAERGAATRQRLLRRYPALTEEIGQLPVKPEAELNAAGTILQAVTAYVTGNHWVAPGKSAFIGMLDHYVETHLRENITICDLCGAFGINRSRLYKLASVYLEETLAAHIRAQRIVHAKRMLETTETPISEIAYAVAFSSYNHFSRVFRQYTGETPSAYRKRTKLL